MKHLLAPLLLLLAACGGSSDPIGPGDGARARKVLLITVDTLRADAVGAFGGEGVSTPGLDALASQSLLFQNAYSQATHTHSALTSVLTGLAPPRHGVFAQSGKLFRTVVPIPVVLQSRGIATGSFVANLCKLEPLDRNVFSLGWDHFFCGMEQGTEQYLWDIAVTEKGIAWMEEQEGDWFAWVHMMDPHAEHRPPPDLWDYDAKPIRSKTEQYRFYGELEKEGQYPEPDQLDDLLAQYDAQVTSTDRQIARLVEYIDGREDADEIAILFSVDHGEELFETWPKYGHGLSLTEGVLRVPTLARVPGVAPRVRDEPVETLRVASTVLDVLDVRAPYALDGPSLLIEDETRDFAVSYCSPLATLRRGEYRVWWQARGSLPEVGEIETFLDGAPQMLATPWYQEPTVLARYRGDLPTRPNWLELDEGKSKRVAFELREKLRLLIDAMGDIPEPDFQDDPALEAQLRDLGYFGH